MGAENSNRRIAVVGAGISGIASAYMLSRRNDVTLFEKRDYVGGHTCTVTIPDGPDKGLPVDVGFIVFNNRNYPNFTRFLNQLNVESADSRMAFSYYDEASAFQYAFTGLNGLLAQRRNIFRPRFWRTIKGTVSFLKIIRGKLMAGELSGMTLGQFSDQQQIAPEVMHDFVIPMAAAIWSTPKKQIMDFPAEAFASFYENHGMLTYRGQPTWRYVCGGSQTYVRKFLESFAGTVRKGSAVTGIRRHGSGADVATAAGTESFDAVVLATHANHSLALLEDPSPEEQSLLGAWNYASNRAVLHSDISHMPPLRRVWASWNYLQHKDASDEAPASLSYYMNSLQCLKTETDYCVTLNASKPFASGSVIREFDFDHPVYSFVSMKTQDELRRLNGTRNTYYAGAHLYNGFHEDGFRSAVDVAAHFGCRL